MKSHSSRDMVGLKLRRIREYNRLYALMLKSFWHLQGRDSARVYMFHSILEYPEQIYSKFAITTSSFEKLLENEISRGQVPMNLDTLKKAVEFPADYTNHFAVSFDDVYDSVYTSAYPVLKRMNIPFIIFITPSLIGTIDPASKNPMITREHLEELMGDDLCIVGSHGMLHKPFRQYSIEGAMKSLMESKTIMGKETELFAFPYGRRIEVSNKDIRCAEKAGYSCGFSALDGSLKQKWFSGNWFLPRILVSEDYVRRNVK